MEERQVSRLKLTVTNPETMRSGADIEHSFGPQGGSIGTAKSDTWQLSAHRTGVVPGHAEIRLLDGGFCLIDRSGRTYINSATQPVGRGRRARLKQGDTLSIGRYRLRTELSEMPADQQLEHRDDAGDRRLVDVAEGELARSAGNQDASLPAEPMEGLPPAPAETISADPMQHLHEETTRAGHEEHALMANKRAWFAAETTVTDEYRENRDVAIGLPVKKGEKDRMSQTNTGMKGRESRDHRTAPANDQSRKHISVAPVLQGMDAGLSFEDSDEMQLFLEEAGQTLKAAIDGLLALHQSEDTRHQALRTRLQPIEDNPLRLGSDYEETVQTLFASQRSPVHLSAPAAVQESLQSLNHHQQATQAAVSEALDAILHAFSPEALLRRFHGYRRGLKQNEDEGRWAWDMYQHYYKELRSSRQQGFERLFQEVFDQAYDQHLRQLQRENLL
ncbi:type VI secretion system-associated FHA domain protein TagH [Marinobacter sp. F3R11]|uniref:type VI secretion system-associated FHA domain protein TagH n=1 Tax=Marinobacter sp. F3R11 TaxID=2267231 RepID=UPI000DEBAC23|nr:type VI secretion system-associated FHA domain protein TagH [Marinobacter sp. F3R11]RBW49171.1 type VI secretion system-associated FHA domain protein TagH [Marinobacter sp. F3R11]